MQINLVVKSFIEVSIFMFEEPRYSGEKDKLYLSPYKEKYKHDKNSKLSMYYKFIKGEVLEARETMEEEAYPIIEYVLAEKMGTEDESLDKQWCNEGLVLSL